MNSTEDSDIILPTPEIISGSNVGRWIHELGFETYDELHRFSVAEMDAFLEIALRKLRIRFRKGFDKILSLSSGIEQPVWFSGARMNIADSVFDNKPGMPAIVSRTEGHTRIQVTSVAELELLSARVANGLFTLGFKSADAIAIDMPMTRECIAIYLGIVRAGMVVISIADSFASEEIATRLRIADARAVFTQDIMIRGGMTLPLYQKVIDAHSPITVVVGTSDSGPELRTHDIWFDRFLSEDFDFDNVDCNPDETINVLFSSGTTGTPKAVPWNHTTPIRSALDGFVHQDIQPGDVIAWPTNVGWMMGPWLIFAALINRADRSLRRIAAVARVRTVCPGLRGDHTGRRSRSGPGMAVDRLHARSGLEPHPGIQLDRRGFKRRRHVVAHVTGWGKTCYRVLRRYGNWRSLYHLDARAAEPSVIFFR